MSPNFLYLFLLTAELSGLAPARPALAPWRDDLAAIAGYAQDQRNIKPCLGRLFLIAEQDRPVSLRLRQLRRGAPEKFPGESQSLQQAFQIASWRMRLLDGGFHLLRRWHEAVHGSFFRAFAR